MAQEICACGLRDGVPRAFRKSRSRAFNYFFSLFFQLCIEKMPRYMLVHTVLSSLIDFFLTFFRYKVWTIPDDHPPVGKKMPNNQRATPDFATMAGALIAMGSVIGGLLLEGGSIRDIAQSTAGLIVVGGTAGAVLISCPWVALAGSLRSLKQVLFRKPAQNSTLLDQLLSLSAKARKSGVASLEEDALEIQDPFLKKAVDLIVDGTAVADMRGMMEIDIIQEELRLESEATVFETAGGYAPTVGIIGAVLGLIQVMKHLENIDEVGRGIAVSFVATVYGVALANLILLPIAAKLKAHAAAHVTSRDLILDGVAGIAEGLNPTLLRMKLDSYIALQPRMARNQFKNEDTVRLSPERNPEPFTA